MAAPEVGLVRNIRPAAVILQTMVEQAAAVLVELGAHTKVEQI
jgi:hypothetical protein